MGRGGRVRVLTVRSTATTYTAQGPGTCTGRQDDTAPGTTVTLSPVRQSRIPVTTGVCHGPLHPPPLRWRCIDGATSTRVHHARSLESVWTQVENEKHPLREKGRLGAKGVHISSLHQTIQSTVLLHVVVFQSQMTHGLHGPSHPR